MQSDCEKRQREEEFEPGTERYRLTSSFYRMAALMRSAAIPGLTLRTDVLPGETHMTAWPLAFIHGIRAVFGMDCGVPFSP